MTVYKIICDKCNQQMGYTTRKSGTESTSYLHSKKLTVEQKGAIYDRRKYTICMKCMHLHYGMMQEREKVTEIVN
ncbi:MAG: hypothetical protein WA364_21940 [Candidatus Nitrosopolaris sp.]